MHKLKKYGDWALITGAATGLGREFVRAIAAQGLNCVAAGLEGDKLIRLAEEVRDKHGVQCRAIEIDLSADDFLEQLLPQIDDIPVGMIVNNAGIGCGGAVASRDPQRLTQLVKLNCLAPVVLTRSLLPDMLRRGQGAVIFVSSLQGFISSPFYAAYCASKAFNLHFGESLWGELRKTPVDCITLCPAGMKTDFFRAEGFSKQDCDRIWKFSSDPAKLANLALRKLGKKPVVSPPTTFFVSLLGRLMPRVWTLRASDKITRKLVKLERS